MSPTVRTRRRGLGPGRVHRLVRRSRRRRQTDRLGALTRSPRETMTSPPARSTARLAVATATIACACQASIGSGQNASPGDSGAINEIFDETDGAKGAGGDVVAR